MKVRGALAVLFVLALTSFIAPRGSAGPSAVDEFPPEHSRPPKHLKQMPDGHWTPWDPPAPAEGADVHTVVPRDTLWDLAANALKNPYLWPHIWDQNRYVLDSHWIYPGDPILLPALEVVPAPAAGAMVSTPEEEEEEDEGEDDADVEQVATPPPSVPKAPARIPLGDTQDVYCAAYLQSERASREPRIVGAESEILAFGQGDIVYLNAGTRDGVAPGARFTILRNGASLKHPVTGKSLGHRIDMMGQLSVIAVQEKGATAEITFACEDVRRGDTLVPFREIPIPTIDRPLGGKIDRYKTQSSGGAAGYVVLSKDPQVALAQGNMVGVDLGQSDGVKPGDVLAIYRPNPEGKDLPRVNLGQAVILMTEARSSVARISNSVREIHLGDRVEAR